MTDATYTFTVLYGEKRLVREEHVRMIMPKARWWEFRYKRERREIEALAASYGMTLYEA